jgi:hypothetical protein
LRLTFFTVSGHAVFKSVPDLEATASFLAAGQMVFAPVPPDLLIDATVDLAVVADTECLANSP